MAKKEFQLADQSTGFFDPETKLKVARDQVVSIDVGKGVGSLTTASIKAGRLIEVNRESKAAAKDEEDTENLPASKGGKGKKGGATQ